MSEEQPRHDVEKELLSEFYDSWRDFHKILNDSRMTRKQKQRASQNLIATADAVEDWRKVKH